MNRRTEKFSGKITSMRMLCWSFRFAHHFKSIVVILGILLSQGVAIAAEMDKTDASVLRRSISKSWYNGDEFGKQDAERLVSSKYVDVSDREKGFRYSASPAPSPTQSKDWNYDFRWLNDSFRWFFETLGFLLTYWPTYLILFIVGILLYLLASYFHWFDFGWVFPARSTRNALRRNRDKIRVTDLPFDLAPSNLSLLEQADRFRSQSNLTQAMVYFYSHLLVEMDEAGLIRLERGKTNRTYLRELRNYPVVKNYIEKNVLRFEQVFFGGYSIEAEQYDALRNQLTTFEGWLKETKQINTTQGEFHGALS